MTSPSRTRYQRRTTAKGNFTCGVKATPATTNGRDTPLYEGSLQPPPSPILVTLNLNATWENGQASAKPGRQGWVHSENAVVLPHSCYSGRCSVLFRPTCRGRRCSLDPTFRLLVCAVLPCTILPRPYPVSKSLQFLTT